MGRGKLIHILGTSSNAGKSTLSMGLCRIISNMGYSVTPFKAMNMSLNSISTEGGFEIARSQWLQARAARIMPDWHINPILLKPEGSGKSQVILKGNSIGRRSLEEYGEILRTEARQIVKESMEFLLNRFDYVVAEGSGSAAEINLYDRDLANTWITHEFNGTGILVVNIENGGAFSSLYGTKILCQYPEVMKYFIINNMRGNQDMLMEGVKKIEEMTGMKNMGIVPHLEGNHLPGEDSLDYERIYGKRVGIIRYPFFENYSDIDPLIQMGLGTYVKSSDQLEGLYSVILPGSKNVSADLEFLIQSGLDRSLGEFADKGGKIMGICGGYQILSRNIRDPANVQLGRPEIKGLNLLKTDFIYEGIKTVSSVKYEGRLNGEYFDVKAYNIHYGMPGNNEEIYFVNTDSGREGSINEKLNVIGTNLHGILENSTVFHWLTGIKRVKSYEEALEENIGKFSENISVNLKREQLMDVLDGL